MKRFGIILFGLSMLLAQPLAGQLTFAPKYAPDLGDQVTYEFVGTEAGTTYGPYLATMPYPGGNLVNVYCVDLGRYIRRGDIVTANVLNLAAPAAAFTGAVAPALYGGAAGADLQEAYQKAAYLAYQMSQNVSLTDWQNIHDAIWHFTSAKAPTAGATTWIANADAAFLGGDYSAHFGEWAVLTTVQRQGDRLVADGGYQTQTLLVQTTVTPEPQTYILMASGLIFMVFFGRRRLKEMGYA